ncbi:MAG: LysM peptidoglycan-binding domain-containing protein [Gemmatimonadota bacterium]|nr:LysM peptidoglycan-binding domain-containing protein [Gemmatimonadota bacterium]
MPIKPVTSVVRDRRRILWGAAALISFVALARCASAQAPVVQDSASEVSYTVKNGDTLWDLARTYLKNPFRWPDLFRRNADVVRNPHWIYPGEVIRIPAAAVRPEALSQLSNPNVVARVATVPSRLTVFAVPALRALSKSTGAGVIPDKYRAPGVRAGEMESAPFVDRSGGPRLAGKITAAVDRPAIATSDVDARFQINDQLYVNLPKGMTPRLGDRYLAYTLGDEIESVGQLIVPTAILRVERITAGEPPIVRIIRQFGEVRIGQRLIVAEDTPAVTRQPHSIGAGMTGKVLLVHQDPVLPSVQHYVVLSPTSRDGIAVGDEFTLVDVTMGRDDPTPAPPVSAAVAQVVRVNGYATTAIIVRQLQPAIKEGMPVRLTAKMP